MRASAFDAIVERFDADPVGTDFVAQHAGPHVKGWFDTHSSPGWSRTRADELIDLWGVREELAAVLPGTPLTDIPGISQPREFDGFPTLTDAKASPEGTVILAAFGQSHLYAVLRAADVAGDTAALRRGSSNRRGAWRRRAVGQAGRLVSPDSAR